MHEQVLTDEALRTFITMAEGIMNNRPLTALSDDPADLGVITPNHLLLLRTSELPLRQEGAEVIASRTRWRQVQYFANLFWSRWTRDYLPQLRARTKWNTRRRNVRVNDIVLVMDKTEPKEKWPLGRVIRVRRGNDGLVRDVRVQTATGRYDRPVIRLCVLEEAADERGPADRR